MISAYIPIHTMTSGKHPMCKTLSNTSFMDQAQHATICMAINGGQFGVWFTRLVSDSMYVCTIYTVHPPLSSPIMDGLVCQNDLIPCSQDQHSFPCPQPPPDLHPLQSTLQSPVETSQCRPTVIHHTRFLAITDCDPNHSMDHQPSSAQPVPQGSLTSPEGVEARRNETRLSKGKDTRGRIPQKSSSGQADNPPSKRTR